VPRRLTYEVRERIGAEGQVLQQLDTDQAREVLRAARAASVEAVAVCFLWSIANPEHELAFGRMVAEELPGVPYTLSHQVNPVMREYRRASSAAIDASLKPLMQDHIATMAAELKRAGLAGEVLVLTSFGGCMQVSDVISRPIYAMDSGPSVAPVGGLAAARANGLGGDVIVCDAGGTSFDVSIVDGGRIRVTNEKWVGDGRTGHLTGMPAVEVRSIGAGGGSVAWVDEGGLLHVGPRSAGSVPGPACYGLGGTEATLTDAAVVLGYLDPSCFLGGRMPLDADAASAALQHHVGTPLGVSAQRAAELVFTVANDLMATAVREITVNAGIDPQDYLLVAGGGAAGLNVVPIAAELGCNRVLVPRVAPTLSAAGAHSADIATEVTVSVFLRSDDLDQSGANAALDRLEEQLDAFLRTLRSSALVTFRKEFSAGVRYPAQIWELEVPMSASRFSGPRDIEELTDRFHAKHERLYAHRESGSPVEIAYLKGRVVAGLTRPSSHEVVPFATEPIAPDSAPAVFGGVAQGTTRYWADQLPRGWTTAGPAIVGDETTTLVVYPGWLATLTDQGDFLLTRQEAP
jgi:N-methylhydantoinase A